MFEFKDLIDVTRAHMLDEANIKGAQVTEYYGRRLTQAGRAEWPELLREAIRAGTAETLTREVSRRGLIKLKEMSHRNGVPYEKKVPSNAAELLAEGEFNRYYCRAVCLRAIAEGRMVKVYRGRNSANPRPESEEWIGKLVDPKALLEDLRTNVGGEPALGLPSVNSGLTVCLA